MHRRDKSGYLFSVIILAIIFLVLPVETQMKGQAFSGNPSIYPLLLLDSTGGDADGAPCTQASDCVSGHCQNGYCCQAGDCCLTPADCAAYGVPSTCDTASTCQGHREDPTCVVNSCGSADVDDDSGCDGGTEASDCGYYPSVYCNGSGEQSAPSCDVDCVSDPDCDANAHCDDGFCMADMPDGGVCDEHSDCQSSHCQNGYCCQAGDCCLTPADCAAYGVPSTCDTASTCQGHREDPTCVVNSCGSADVDDDSGCDGGTEASDCGYYPSVYCNGSGEQSAPSCDVDCVSDPDCDANAHCVMGLCVPD